jgi:hypothetical protein
MAARASFFLRKTAGERPRCDKKIYIKNKSIAVCYTSERAGHRLLFTK